MFFLIGHTLINSLTNSLSHIQQLLIYFFQYLNLSSKITYSVLTKVPMPFLTSSQSWRPLGNTTTHHTQLSGLCSKHGQLLYGYR